TRSSGDPDRSGPDRLPPSVHQHIRGNAAMADYQLYIDGALCDAAAGETFATYNPATGEKIADIAKADRNDAVRAIEAARKAFDEGPWSKMSGADRAAKVRKISELITANAAELAELETLDGGGTIRK